MKLDVNVYLMQLPQFTLKKFLMINLVEILKNEYDIWVSTARDDLSKDMIFRVGHMGDLSTEDNDTLIDALRDIQKRGLF